MDREPLDLAAVGLAQKCRTCGSTKAFEDFPLAGGGYRRKECKGCWSKREVRRQQGASTGPRRILVEHGERGILLALRRAVDENPQFLSALEKLTALRLSVALEIDRLGRVESPWKLVIEAAEMMKEVPGSRAGVGGMRRRAVERAAGVELHRVPEQLRTPRMKPESDLSSVLREVVIGEGERGMEGLDDSRMDGDLEPPEAEG